jgi:hypothetical protein
MKVLLKAVVDYANWVHIVGIFAILLCLRSVLLARHERERSIYTLEKEAATSKEFRVLTIGLIVGAVMGVMFLLTTVIAPRVTFVEPEEQPVTPAAALVLPTVTPTRARPTPTATATATRVRPLPTPTFIAITLAPPEPTATPPPPPPSCPNSLARLTAPAQNATVSGAVQILGSANIPNFDYYKIEYSSPAKPGHWALITDLRRGSVAGGLLDVWDTTAFPNGPYTLRLVVVDNTGNYPDPCTVQVTVSNQ